MKKYHAIGFVLSLIILALIIVPRNDRLIRTSSAANSLPTIIVDAGHGGEDGGTVTNDGTQESHLNLQIALRTEQILALSGLTPYMIRSEDISVYTGDCQTLSEKKVSDLKNRVNTANSVSNGIIVSIHQNHFSQPDCSGAQTFYAGTDGSRELADCIQSLFRDTLNKNNNRKPQKSKSVYLMDRIACTGVLVECGFLSNPEEAVLLQDPTYQNKMACILCAAINVYLEGLTTNEI